MIAEVELGPGLSTLTRGGYGENTIERNCTRFPAGPGLSLEIHVGLPVDIERLKPNSGPGRKEKKKKGKGNMRMPRSVFVHVRFLLDQCCVGLRSGGNTVSPATQLEGV